METSVHLLQDYGYIPNCLLRIFTASNNGLNLVNLSSLLRLLLSYTWRFLFIFLNLFLLIAFLITYLLVVKYDILTISYCRNIQIEILTIIILRIFHIIVYYHCYQILIKKHKKSFNGDFPSSLSFNFSKFSNF